MIVLNCQVDVSAQVCYHVARVVSIRLPSPDSIRKSRPGVFETKAREEELAAKITESTNRSVPEKCASLTRTDTTLVLYL
jgi:hypothetical protein